MTSGLWLIWACLFTPFDKSVSNLESVFETFESREYSEGANFPTQIWTDATGNAMAPPAQASPPDGFIFSGDWIVDDINEFGNKESSKRRWMRQLVKNNDSEVERNGQDDVCTIALEPILMDDDLFILNASTPELPKQVNNSAAVPVNYTQSKRYRWKEMNLFPKIFRIPRSSLVPVPPAVAKLFSVFVFKGVGLAMSKSIIQWNAFSFAIKLPVTSHFPEYDRKLILPRIGSSIGVAFPLNYRISLSGSLPITSVHYGLACVGQLVNVTTAEYCERLRRAKATESIRRVGLTLSFRFNPVNGWRVSFGSWGYYLPPRSLLDVVLPFLYLIPTALINIAIACKLAFGAGAGEGSGEGEEEGEEGEEEEEEDEEDGRRGWTSVQWRERVVAAMPKPLGAFLSRLALPEPRTPPGRTRAMEAESDEMMIVAESVPDGDGNGEGSAVVAGDSPQDDSSLPSSLPVDTDSSKQGSKKVKKSKAKQRQREKEKEKEKEKDAVIAMKKEQAEKKSRSRGASVDMDMNRDNCAEATEGATEAVRVSSKAPVAIVQTETETGDSLRPQQLLNASVASSCNAHRDAFEAAAAVRPSSVVRKRFDFWRWHEWVMSCASAKTVGLGCDGGIFRSGCVWGPASSLVLDVAPFYPLERQLDRMQLRAAVGRARAAWRSRVSPAAHAPSSTPSTAGGKGESLGGRG